MSIIALFIRPVSIPLFLHIISTVYHYLYFVYTQETSTAKS